MPQSLSRLYVHLVFGTKHREPTLLSPVREHIHAYLAAVLKNQDSPAPKIGGTSDHVHSLFRLSKNISLAKIVEEVKTSSSKISLGGAQGSVRSPLRGFGGIPSQAAGVPHETGATANAEAQRVDGMRLSRKGPGTSFHDKRGEKCLNSLSDRRQSPVPIG
jgi:REP element-mobilizing transposase RayT